MLKTTHAVVSSPCEGGMFGLSCREGCVCSPSPSMDPDDMTAGTCYHTSTTRLCGQTIQRETRSSALQLFAESIPPPGTPLDRTDRVRY